MTNKGCDRGLIIDAVPISELPAEVVDLAVPGHWEEDLISGSMNSHIATLVERKTRFFMQAQVDGKDTQTVVEALIRQVSQLPDSLKKRSRGIEVRNWLAIIVFVWPQIWRSISATLAFISSEDKMRILTAY